MNIQRFTSKDPATKDQSGDSVQPFGHENSDSEAYTLRDASLRASLRASAERSSALLRTALRA